MLIYNKKSSSKVVHYSHCHHIKGRKQDIRGTFDTLEEARRAGYRLCKCCAPMAKFYRKEVRDLVKFAAENGLSFCYEDGMVDIQSPYSRWKVVVVGKLRKKLAIYHKNTQVRKKEKPTMIPGYHSQAFRADTILDYMKFVLSHDAYHLAHEGQRYAHPQEIVVVNPLALTNASPAKQQKKEKGKPMTKHQLRVQKRAERRSHISMVHRMIEEERRKRADREQAEAAPAEIEMAQMACC